MAKIVVTTANASKDEEYPYAAGGNVKCHSRKQFGSCF